MVPVFLIALLLVRGVPALVYRGVLGGRRALVAGILQATSLPFIVAATAIGLELGLLDAAESAALIGAGLRTFAVPQILNVEHGVFIVENLDTSELATADVRGSARSRLSRAPSAPKAS